MPRFAAEFARLRPIGQDQAGVAIGGVGLAAVGDAAPGQHRFQPGQPRGGGGEDAFIILHRGRDLAPAGIDLDRRDHVAAMEGGVEAIFVWGQGLAVLFIAQQRYLVLFGGGNAAGAGHIFGGFDHAQPHKGIAIEVVPHPIFGIPAAAGGQGVGIEDVGAVGGAVGGDAEDGAGAGALDLIGGAGEDAGGGGAGLGHGGPGDLPGADHPGHPGRAIEAALTGHRRTQEEAVETGGGNVTFGQRPPRRLRRKFQRVQVGECYPAT